MWILILLCVVAMAVCIAQIWILNTRLKKQRAAAVFWAKAYKMRKAKTGNDSEKR